MACTCVARRARSLAGRSSDMGSAGWMASSGRGPLAVGGRSGFHSLAPSALGMTEAAR
eukprot:COSAG02_NODE_44187_length_368_cov_0.869888_1_plen_57_part_01